MKVLMLSTDTQILEPESESSARMREYGGLVRRLDIIIASCGSKWRAAELLPHTHVVPTNSVSKFLYVWDMICVALRIARQQQVGWDVVTAQDPFETGLSAWLIVRRCGARLHLQIHTDFLNPFFARESVKNRVRVFLALRLLPKADAIRVVSERIKVSLLGLGIAASKITVLPIFVDTKKIISAPITVDLHKKYPRFDIIVLMASRLAREKNIGLALSAFGVVVAQYPKIALVIAGNGPEKDFLQRTSRDLGIADHVMFEGMRKDLSSYYKTADIFLNTSNYEGYGRTLIEAAAVGCPLIATDVGVVGEVINKDNSLIIQVGDKDALVQNLINLAKDGSLRHNLEQKAKQTVKNLETKEAYLKKYKLSWQL